MEMKWMVTWIYDYAGEDGWYVGVRHNRYWRETELAALTLKQELMQRKETIDVIIQQVEKR